MAYYITYGEFHRHMKEYYLRTGNRMQFPEMINYLYNKGLLMDTPPQPLPSSRIFGDMDDDEFNEVIDQLVLTIDLFPPVNPWVTENDIIPHSRDVFIIRHPRYTRPAPHSHNYFEIDYVANGKCTFVFEKTSRTLGKGEICVIAPSSEHDLVIDDDSTVFCIMLRKSTFDMTFFSLLSRKDLLSYFFRTTLQDDSHANFLLFFAENTQWINQIIHNAMAESYKNDPYSNSCCISWINLLFSNLLRSYSKTLQFYDYQMGSDFSLVLQYIQHNYQNLTLSSLAELFHYSEPHLCTLIKQNTGHNFTGLVKRLRMSEAVDYLTNTNLKISEIAERVGYNSADHFSRVFRKTYNMSPLEYRRENSQAKETFIPFATNEEMSGE